MSIETIGGFLLAVSLTLIGIGFGMASARARRHRSSHERQDHAVRQAIINSIERHRDEGSGN